MSPVIYPMSMVNKKYQWLLALNPMGGVIKAYRASILGHIPIDWGLLGLSAAIILVLGSPGACERVLVERLRTGLSALQRLRQASRNASNIRWVRYASWLASCNCDVPASMPSSARHVGTEYLRPGARTEKTRSA